MSANPISSPMGFRVLGPIQVCRGGVWIPLGGTKQRTVLAALLLAGAAGVPNQRLERLLWGDHPPETAHAQIQTYIYKLRELLCPDAEVVRQGAGYMLGVPRDEFDLHEFERNSDRGRRALSVGDAQTAAGELRLALARWNGPALGDVTEFLRRAELPRLEELRLAALEDRIDADLALGQEKELVPELTGLVAEHPLRERMRGSLMLALHRSGRQADALAVYREGRRILVEEAGLEPGNQLRGIHEAILEDPDPAIAAGAAAHAADAAEAATRAVAPASLRRVARPRPGELAAVSYQSDERLEAGRPAQLPPLDPDLVGRDKEIAIALDWFQPDHRSDGPQSVPVCTVTGMAGVGKTVLAVHVAHQLRARYPDGHLYVDLHADSRPLRPPEVLARFLHALNADRARLPGGMEDRLSLYRSWVAYRRILIVLDNASSAYQIRPLLPAGAGCAVLVTCRTRLPGLEGAGALDLDVFEPHQAVELIGRIAGVQRVAAEPETAERIAGMCGYLPLAVRIAGARLAARPHWPLSRLADDLTDEGSRLDELSHDDLEVRGSLIASLRGLSAAGLRALRLLAELDVPRFPSWVVASALAVSVKEAEKLIDTLVDARLLEVAVPGGAPWGCYRFHNLVRTVAREQTVRTATQATRRAVLGHTLGAWLALAGEAHRRLAGHRFSGSGDVCLQRLPDQATVDALLADPLAWFEAERPVLRAVIAQGRAQDHVLAAALGQMCERLEIAASRVAGVKGSPSVR
jgi:DNA-binding SARP family transcriptional activator